MIVLLQNFAFKALNFGDVPENAVAERFSQLLEKVFNTIEFREAIGKYCNTTLLFMETLCRWADA